jgi:hypothetical protein
MRPWLLMMATMLSLASCGPQPPRLRPATQPVQAQWVRQCRAAFPTGRWQLVHSIEARLPDGSRSQFLGVTRVAAETRTVDCALMTVEGFVLFSARSAVDAPIRVDRAVGPFARKGFAAGILRDIRTLFLEPPYVSVAAGTMSDRSGVCRYPLRDGGMLDLQPEDDGWTLMQYDATGQLRRSAVARGGAGGKRRAEHIGEARSIDLEAHGIVGYQLHMRLVQATPLAGLADDVRPEKHF